MHIYNILKTHQNHFKNALYVHTSSNLPCISKSFQLKRFIENKLNIRFRNNSTSETYLNTALLTPTRSIHEIELTTRGVSQSTVIIPILLFHQVSDEQFL